MCELGKLVCAGHTSQLISLVIITTTLLLLLLLLLLSSLLLLPLSGKLDDAGFASVHLVAYT